MLETERLLIRKFIPEDLPKLIELRSSAEVNKYLGGTRLQNAEAITKRMQFYVDSYEKYGFGMCAMIWKETGEFFGFHQKNLNRVVAVAAPENTGSWRIMEKLGMSYEKTEEHYGMKCKFYAISKDEFLNSLRQTD